MYPRRLAATVALLVLASASAAAAHPLGNFTVNHLSRIVATKERVRVRYVLDLAEIPTFALDRSLDAHGTPSRGVLARWAQNHAASIAPELSLDVDGRRVTLTPNGATVSTRAGAGGLPTRYFTATYSAPLGAGAHRLVYRDRTESGRLGWRDVVVGTDREPTDELRSYPNALAGSPRTRTAIAATVDASGRIAAESGVTLAAEEPAGAAALVRSNALSDVLARGATDPLVVLGALLIAIALGGLHALEPGHGKTLLAVSLVGSRATARQALMLASALTVAHTAGVLALGVVLIAAAEWIVPEHVYPWITLGSGIFVTILGARAVAREVHHRHDHPHAHPHHAISGTAPLTFRDAVLAAASGNVAPCPAALVVLLAAIGLHRIGYGLALIVAFSFGLAAVLTILGIAVVRSAAWLVARPRFDRIARFAPLVTACVIATVGAAMVGQGFLAQGIGVPVPVVATLVLIAVAGYAFAGHHHGHGSSAGVHA